MRITGIDPGNEKTAIVIIETIPEIKIVYKEILPNHVLLRGVTHNAIPEIKYSKVVIEQIACYGMPVGESVFQTVRFYGRLEQALYDNAYDGEVAYITRNKVKNNICNSSKAKDANVRQALIDRIGVQGTKKNQGPTYGISADMWSALAVALTHYDLEIRYNCKF